MHALNLALAALRRCGTDDANAALREIEEVSPRALPGEIRRARDAYQDDDCEIDDDAVTSDAPVDGGKWIQAWVWIPYPETDDEGGYDPKG